MITPAYSPTANERVLPRLALDFTTASLDPRVTFARSGNTATVTNSVGVIAAINADLPRFDYNPTTLACKGLLIEEARTNLLLNSLINGTSLSTQIVTTTAVAHTLSFYGTGQIVLTGASSATVVGAGAYPTRTTLTFTPIVGALTLTVTGTVQYAQLEVGAFATSFIPTAGAAVTRNADVATMTGTNFSSWYNATEGAFSINAICPNFISASQAHLFAADDGTTNSRMRLFIFGGTGGSGYYQVVVGGAGQADLLSASPYTAGQAVSAVCVYKANSFAAAYNGNSTLLDNLGLVPTVTTLRLGVATGLTNFLNSTIQKFSYYPQRLTNAEVQAFSK